MKKLLCAALSILCLSLAYGCATPAYSGGLATIKFPEERASGENQNRVLRNWHYENRMMMDDINSVLMLEPASGLTKWNAR